MFNVFAYLAIVLLLTWFVEKQKIFNYLFFNEYLKKLRSCPICLGFWVALILYPVFQVGLFNNFDLDVYGQVVNAFVTSILVTLNNYYLRLGIQTVHGIIKLN